MRNLAALALCHLPDGLAGARLDLFAIQLELDGRGPPAFAADDADRLGVRDIGAAVGHRLAAGAALGIVAIALRLWAVAHLRTSQAPAEPARVIPRLPSAQILPENI